MVRTGDTPPVSRLPSTDTPAQTEGVGRPTVQQWAEQRGASLRTEAQNMRSGLPEAYRDLPAAELVATLREDLGESSPLFRQATSIERKEKMATRLEGALTGGDTRTLIRMQDAEDNVGAIFHPREWATAHRDGAQHRLDDTKSRLRTAVGAQDFDRYYTDMSPQQLLAALREDCADNTVVQRYATSFERGSRHVESFNTAIAAYDAGNTAPLEGLREADRTVDHATVGMRAAFQSVTSSMSRNPAEGLTPPAPQKAHR